MMDELLALHKLGLASLRLQRFKEQWHKQT